MIYEPHEKTCGNCRHWGRNTLSMTVPAVNAKYAPAYHEPLVDVRPCLAGVPEHDIQENAGIV